VTEAFWDVPPAEEQLPMLPPTTVGEVLLRPEARQARGSRRRGSSQSAEESDQDAEAERNSRRRSSRKRSSLISSKPRSSVTTAAMSSVPAAEGSRRGFGFGSRERVRRPSRAPEVSALPSVVEVRQTYSSCTTDSDGSPVVQKRSSWFPEGKPLEHCLPDAPRLDTPDALEEEELSPDSECVVSGVCRLCDRWRSESPLRAWGNPGCRGCSLVDRLHLADHVLRPLLLDWFPLPAPPRQQAPTGSASLDRPALTPPQVATAAGATMLRSLEAPLD
jgi:hypothetical protein